MCGILNVFVTNTDLLNSTFETLHTYSFCVMIENNVKQLRGINSNEKTLSFTL